MATIKKAAPKKVVSAPVKAATKKVSKAATPAEKLFHLSDDDVDLEAFDAIVNADVKTKASRAVSTCPQGKQPKVIRDNPTLSPPVNTTNYIVELHVKLSTQNLKVTWSNGTVNNWLCSPNPRLTPKGNDVVGHKCGAKHTNYKKDGMAWFTAFKSRGMAYGFHNSQRVGLGVVSHGCVRVACEHAKIVNQNSWSGKTKIKIIA